MISERPVLRTAVLSVERGIRFHISNILLLRYAYRKLSSQSRLHAWLMICSVGSLRGLEVAWTRC